MRHFLKDVTHWCVLIRSPFAMSASKATSLSPKKKASLGSPDPVCFTSPKNFLSGSKKRRFTSQLTCEAQSLTVKLLTEHAIAPKRGSAGAAGYDLARCVPFNEATSELYRSAYDYTIAPKGRLAIKTDVAMALPEGTYGRVAPRSGLAVNSGIDVGGGVIDSDYRGPVSVVLFNHGDTEFQGERVKGD